MKPWKCILVGSLAVVVLLSSPPSAPPTHPAPIPCVKPDGIDLDVTLISRAPLYHRYDVEYTADGKPYLRPGSEGDRRWPNPGEVVTFTAHVANKGTLASGDFAFKWRIDGAEVALGSHPSIAPGEEVTATCTWSWDHTVENERLLGEHTVRFEVDPDDAIAETYESNNSLEDRTDALSLVLAVTPDLYAALETPVDPKWPFSAEDWLQKQIAAMNAAFTRSVYASAPDGIEERVRLDKILVTATAPPADSAVDGGFFMTADDRYGNPYYDPATDVSGGLLHELTHQLGIIDLYGLDVALEIPQVLDRSGHPVQMEYWSEFPGLMSDPGIRPPIYAEHTALALNANKGYRRGYYGEYLYDVPGQTSVRVLDNEGNPAAGVTVNLYQKAFGPNMLGSKHGAIDNEPEISVQTDASGIAVLPNRPVGEPVSTHTGHTLHDNPFGVINVIGSNDEFLLELRKGAHQEYRWLLILDFNLAAWRGEATLEIASQAPPDGAPDPPAALTGALAYGQVALQWSPAPSPDIAGYHIYRTAGPAAEWTRVVAGTAALSLTLAYDNSARAVGYAVTAVDTAGRESGFSDLFWALRLQKPSGIVLTEDLQRRIVLDPQNGYALLLQSPDGAFVDTLGSFDLHLENSRYLARDAQGRLLISHPADWYSSRHSVRVTDSDANLLFEFGEYGSDPGEFATPAGVAAWGSPPTFGGPYATDAHTLLLLHFDGDYTGVEGEPGAPNGTTFAPGRHDQGALVDAGDTLTYTTAGNIRRDQGAIEFWLRPQWEGDDGQSYTFFEVGNTWYNRMRIMKDGANNLRFIVWDNSTERGVAYNVGHWQAGEWRHVAATWGGSEIALYVDGEQRASRNDANPPATLADAIYIGSDAWSGQQANAVIDELRISDVPRVGNSDTIHLRILVADSGNHRLQVFDGEGDFVSAYGSYGAGPDAFDTPQGLAVDDAGAVLVADGGNHRLQVLSFDGTDFSFVREITAAFNGPTGVATYGADRIVVADTGNHAVKVLNAAGGLLATYGAPNGGDAGAFDHPRGVAADRYARIIVADTGNKRVVTIVGALPALPPTDVAVTGPVAGAGRISYTFTATVGAITATLPMTYVWQATAHAPVTHTDRADADTVSFAWTITGTQTLTVTAMNAGGAVTGTHTLDLSPPSTVYLPLILRQFNPQEG